MNKRLKKKVAKRRFLILVSDMCELRITFTKCRLNKSNMHVLCYGRHKGRRVEGEASFNG